MLTKKSADHKLIRYFFLKHIEVVDDNSDEQIQGEEGAADDEYHKVEIGIEIGLALGLEIYAPRIDRVLHHLHPTLEGRDLKEGQVGDPHVIERDLAVLPGVIQPEAIFLRVYHLRSVFVL